MTSISAWELLHRKLDLPCFLRKTMKQWKFINIQPCFPKKREGDWLRCLCNTMSNDTIWEHVNSLPWHEGDWLRCLYNTLSSDTIWEPVHSVNVTLTWTLNDTYITLAYQHKTPVIFSMEDLDHDLSPIFISWKFFENMKTRIKHFA